MKKRFDTIVEAEKYLNHTLDEYVEGSKNKRLFSVINNFLLSQSLIDRYREAEIACKLQQDIKEGKATKWEIEDGILIVKIPFIQPEYEWVNYGKARTEHIISMVKTGKIFDIRSFFRFMMLNYPCEMKDVL